MTGPAHYAMAEEILARMEADEGAPELDRNRALRALAHATLANAAAAALGTSPAESQAWSAAAGTKMSG